MRTNMIMTFIAACALGLITTGCATITGGNDGNKMVEIPAGKVNHIPEWFLARPSPDSKDIIVTATDVSKDMQFAIDKATLNAKIALAERLGTKVESLTRESTLESGQGVKDVQREIDRVSKVRVSQDLSFFTREHLSVVKEGDHYRAFVMLKISNEEGRRLTTKDNSRSREERLKELDKTSSAPVDDGQVVVRPVSQVDRSKMVTNTISDESVKARVAKVLEDPNAVVINATIR
jgi:hypothetical protein